MKAHVNVEGSSPTADLVGERWGLEAGSLRWWRTSNSSTATALDLTDPEPHGLAELERALIRHIDRCRGVIVDAAHRLGSQTSRSAPVHDIVPAWAH